eukprot:1851358-Amphidinium_carterae.1
MSQHLRNNVHEVVTTEHQPASCSRCSHRMCAVPEPLGLLECLRGQRRGGCHKTELVVESGSLRILWLPKMKKSHGLNSEMSNHGLFVSFLSCRCSGNNIMCISSHVHRSSTAIFIPTPVHPLPSNNQQGCKLGIMIAILVVTPVR